MAIEFSEKEIDEVIYKVSEIQRIASLLENSNNFSAESFNSTLAGIIKNFAIMFLPFKYSKMFDR